NGTFGLPAPWHLDEVRAGELTLTVEAVEPVLSMRLEGSALLSRQANNEKDGATSPDALDEVVRGDPAGQELLQTIADHNRTMELIKKTALRPETEPVYKRAAAARNVAEKELKVLREKLS